MITAQKARSVPSNRRRGTSPKPIEAETRIEGECPLCAAHGYQPNAETLAAVQEARDIMSGKIQAKTYYSLDELNRELDAEYEAEYGAKC
ncbi:MAG: hypothetical protein MdMp014T_2590 [Treponematales bacterium]